MATYSKSDPAYLVYTNLLKITKYIPGVWLSKNIVITKKGKNTGSLEEKTEKDFIGELHTNGFIVMHLLCAINNRMIGVLYVIISEQNSGFHSKPVLFRTLSSLIECFYSLQDYKKIAKSNNLIVADNYLQNEIQFIEYETPDYIIDKLKVTPLPNIEVRAFNYLAYIIEKPQHNELPFSIKKLTKEEVESELRLMNAEKKQLFRISRADPVCIWNGYVPGDVLDVVYTNSMGNEKYYYLVA